MGANARSKGQRGEREICDLLNGICKKLELEGVAIGYNPDFPKFQRNQNQSAVGGSDLTNPYGLSIEVKRQEALSVNTWWEQCLAAADTTNEIPILIYKQNRQKWKVLMWMDIGSFIGDQYLSHEVRAQTDMDSFLEWFALYIRKWHEVNK